VAHAAIYISLKKCYSVKAFLYFYYCKNILFCRYYVLLMMLKAIAFDFDGTLYPSYKMYTHSFFFFLKHFLFVYHFSCVRKEMRKRLYIGEFRKTQASLLAKRLKIPEKRAYQKIQSVVYGEWTHIFKKIKPFPYLKLALKNLKKNGLKLAILSDYPVVEKIRHLGLEGIWDCAFSSEEIGYLKPYPQAFKALCQYLKLLPEEILYVGDRYHYDIIGAKKAGFKTAFRSLNPINNKYVDLQFSSYRKFMDKIRRI
jgi:putative hydrolase of the HAD superfamily